MTAIPFPPPDPRILARRAAIIAGLARLVPPECLITTVDERRAFETDALTAYRRLPLAVVLPRSTEEVSAVLQFMHEEGVKVVPRGAGTSLSGGAIPQEDAVVVGVSKLNRILEVDYGNRVAAGEDARIGRGKGDRGHERAQRFLKISSKVFCDDFNWSPESA